MTLILLVLAAVMVALQIALTFTLKRMIDLLAGTREQVDALQRRVLALEQERDARVPPPSALFTLAPRVDSAPQPEPQPQPEPVARAAPAQSALPADPSDLPLLREPAPDASDPALADRVRELARQGLPVRDIAERCSLSEAETELMIRLQPPPR
jgi:hypothetical protein